MERDLKTEPFTAAELDALIGARDYAEFVSTKSPAFKALDLSKDALPKRREMLALMAKDVNLVRRPLLFAGDDVIIGYDQARYAALAGKRSRA